MATFYLNGTTLENSTSIYTNAALTNCAPNGFYSDTNSGIVRELSGCILGPIQNCPECLTPCGSPIGTGSLNNGVYELNVELVPLETPRLPPPPNAFPTALPTSCVPMV